MRNAHLIACWLGDTSRTSSVHRFPPNRPCPDDLASYPAQVASQRGVSVLGDNDTLVRAPGDGAGAAPLSSPPRFAAVWALAPRSSATDALFLYNAMSDASTAEPLARSLAARSPQLSPRFFHPFLSLSPHDTEIPVASPGGFVAAPAGGGGGGGANATGGASSSSAAIFTLAFYWAEALGVSMPGSMAGAAGGARGSHTCFLFFLFFLITQLTLTPVIRPPTQCTWC